MGEAASRFEGIADFIPTLVAIVDMKQFQIVDINSFGLALLGYERDELVGSDYREIVHEIDQRPDQVTESGAGSALMLERRLRRSDGEFVNFSMCGRPMEDDGHLMLAGRPIDDLAHADSALADLLQLSELTNDVFLVCDKHGFVRYGNRAANELHQVDDALGLPLTGFIHESDTGYPKLLEAYRNEAHRASGRVVAKGPAGEPIVLSVQTVYDPETERWFTVERDVRALVEQEKRLAILTKDLERRASTDDLTGVANRAALNELIETALEHDAPFGLLMMDMDDFKSVNDTLGHATGDEFLRIVAQRLSRVTAGTGTVGRLGGDEFVLFLPGVDEVEAALIAARVIQSIGSPFAINGVTISRSCSIGIALSKPGDDASAILRRADQAGYEAKHAGRSRFKIHGGPSESWPTSDAVLSERLK